MKEDLSLDDLADVFSPAQDQMGLKPEEVKQRNIVSDSVLKMYMNFRGTDDLLDFNDILSAYILNTLIVAGDIALEEGNLLLQILQEARIAFEGEPCEVILIRKLGVFTCFAVSPAGKICIDKKARLIARISTSSIIEELKCKMI